jgi:hypothetical protein
VIGSAKDWQVPLGPLLALFVLGAGGAVPRLGEGADRALRSLTELRRRSLAVRVQNARQVNVGHQQVNLGREGPRGVPGLSAGPGGPGAGAVQAGNSGSDF